MLTPAERIVNEQSTALYRCQVVDENGDPIAKAQITALTLTLYVKSDGTVLNSRSAQSVLDANGGTLSADLTVSAATQANPVVITFSASHGLRTGDLIYLESVGGMTELNDRTFRVKKVNATKVSLDNEDGTSHTAYTSGGTARIGLFTQVFDEGDNVINDSTLISNQLEEHIALFEWTYGTKFGKNEVQIDVKQLTKVT